MPTSSRKLTCRNGHTFSLPVSVEDQEVVPCPACTVDVVVTRSLPPTAVPDSLTARSVDEPVPRGRGLWQLMQRSSPSEEIRDDAQDAAVEPAVAKPESSPKSPLPVEPRSSERSESEPSRPRGLWALMGGAPTVRDEATPLLGAKGDTDGDQFSATTMPFSNPPPTALDDVDDEDGLELDDDSSQIARPTEMLVGAQVHYSASAEEQVRSRCRRAIALALLSVLMAPLNVLPWFVVKIPGAALGLVAVFLGHQVYGAARRAPDRRKRTLLSMSAIVLGLVGMLAGPAGLNALGTSWQQASLQRGATNKLQAIGTALTEYHVENDKYPLGGTVARDADGEEVGMHGWMTSLLPYLGHAELERKINLKQPYDHPSNRAAMSQVVPEFLVPNVLHEPHKQGFAVAHYSGVGGQGTGPNGLVNYGLFDRNVSVTRADVSDGLSQTLVVGEISQQLPAWGDPENWRQIESGLNRHSLGFGNQDGTGAHFLMGDGSVRFFPNNTSREVLEQLSTRDGGETVALGAQ